MLTPIGAVEVDKSDTDSIMRDRNQNKIALKTRALNNKRY
jgi:hypothetical protein